MRHNRSDRVLVAGAGPVGAAVAVALAQRDIPVTILEAAPRPSDEWRASTFHPPTLELLETLGVIEKLFELGLRVDRFQYRDRRDGVIAEFSFSLLANDTPFPCRLQCGQHKLTSILLDRLAMFPHVDVEYSSPVLGIAVDDDLVSVTVGTRRGTRILRAPYVVGADGARSTVRQSLNISFPGFTYETRNLVLSTTFDFMAHLDGLAPVNYISDPNEWVLLLQTPEVWRVVLPVQSETTDAEALGEETIQARLRYVVPNARGAFPVSYAGVYRVHERVAESFRCGRALLAGDAAHINSPLGGLGMNAGVHDAVALGERLARVWHGAGGDDELDVYASERRRIALDYVQTQARSYVALMNEADPEARARMQTELRRTASDPEAARRHLLRISMMDTQQAARGKELPTTSTR
jgi:2-polyprenyl-6-methoxyphenol hydroxylase-like FAD-dependent oxidoreductase